MLYIVDIQYYLSGTTKILKEACILPLLQPLKYSYFAFKAPFPLNKLTTRDLTTVNFVHRQLGALHWNEGQHTVEEFLREFTACDIVLCNGLEKSLFLRSILPLCTVVNVNASYANISVALPVCCPLRCHSQCALARAYLLYAHIVNL